LDSSQRVGTIPKALDSIVLLCSNWESINWHASIGEIPMPMVFEVVAVVMAACWLGLMLWPASRIQAENPVAVLRYSRWWRIGSFLGAIAPLVMLVYAMHYFQWESPAKRNLGGFIYLALSVIVGLLLIEVSRVQIVLAEDAILRSSPWSGLASLKWSEVERIRYSMINRWFTAEGAGVVIRVSQNLSGIRIFADLVQRKVAPQHWADAARALAIKEPRTK
jgi:hypothetical protein